LNKNGKKFIKLKIKKCKIYKILNKNDKIFMILNFVKSLIS